MTLVSHIDGFFAAFSLSGQTHPQTHAQTHAASCASSLLASGLGPFAFGGSLGRWKKRQDHLSKLPRLRKYSKREIAFRGLMICANDGCMLTGDVQKKYVYYRCTGYRGRCELPLFREEDIALRLGERLKGLQVPADVVAKIVTALRDDEKDSVGKVDAERSRFQGRLTRIRNRIDQAYTDKLDGVISDEFWRRRTNDWRLEEEQVRMALNALDSAQMGDRVMDAEKIFELANKAYLLYVSQDSVEQAKLLKTVVSNFSVGDVSVTPAYRYPFNLIFQRAKLEEWSGRLDSN